MSTQDPPPVSEDLLRLERDESITVLHVDDEPDFADLVSVYLERANSALEVVTEASAEAGLSRLDEIDVDCVVSDYEMPGTDGLEFLEAVREHNPRLPFVLFTGKGDEEIASEAISAGVTEYLQKSDGTEQYTILENRITNAVSQYRAERNIDRGFRAIETAREGISILDEEGAFRYVNQAYADTYGYDREELIGEHWEILYPDADVRRVYEEVIPSIPDTDRWEGESVHLTKDGRRLVVDHALSYTDSGEIVCLIQDRTDERDAERVLEAERRRFDRFVDAVEEYAIFALDLDGHVTSWNAGAERISGYESDEIVGEHVSAFYPDEASEAGYPDELLATAVEDGWVTDEGWRLRKDGSRFWADVTITTVTDDTDQPSGFLTVTKDGTGTHESDDELPEEQRFLEQALDILEDVFYVLDPEGNITRVTDRAVEVTGYSEAELRSMNPTELFPEAQRAQVLADIETAIETGQSTLEADVLTKDGRTLPYEFRKRRLTDADGAVIGVVGTGRDIADRKRRERQLERQLSQFEQFGSILSHDLQTPLQVVSGRIELAKETGEMEHLDRAEAALERLDTLVYDLATVMREGELVNDIGTVDVEDQVRDVWNALSADGARLRVSETAEIRADPTAFARFVENLLKNTLDHGGDTVTVGLLSDGFYLEDDGPGIPEDIRDEIFEPGYSTKASTDGTGFGLASARQIAVAHGWELIATESDSGGARFEVTDVEMV